MRLQPVTRPKFAQWRYDRNLTLRSAAAHINAAAGEEVCSYEAVRRICLPFGDERRSIPSDKLAAAIEVLTRGAVTPRDFTDPQLRQCAA